MKRPALPGCTVESYSIGGSGPKCDSVITAIGPLCEEVCRYAAVALSSFKTDTLCYVFNLKHLKGGKRNEEIITWIYRREFDSQ